MRIVLLLVCALVLSSCFKEVDIYLSKPEPRLVIGSYMTHDVEIEAVVTKVVSASDTVYTLPEEAEVVISANGVSYPMQYVKDSLYRASLKGQYGVEYELVASAAGYPTVSATDKIPLPVDFTIDKYVPKANVDYEGDDISSITITLKNVPKDRTYFELRMIGKVFDVCGQGEDSQYYEYLRSQDIVVRNEGVVNYNYTGIGLLFSNELINDKAYQFSFEFFNMVGDACNGIDEVEIQLRTVSESYFLFKKRLYLNLVNQVGDLWDGSGNPVDAYTNINNGYGIFAGYSQISHIKKL